MTATADLRDEHEGVGRMLDVMDAMARRASSGETLSETHLDEVIDFLRVFVDQCHHGKEERVLFPTLEREGITTTAGVIKDLRAEHIEGRTATARITEATERLFHGGGITTAPLGDALREYTALLRRHIPREEDDCFDIADARLPASVQDALPAEYERIERDVIGEGRHEQFHLMLERLEAEYERTPHLIEGSRR